MEYTLNLAPINTMLTIKQLNNLSSSLLIRLGELGLIVGQSLCIVSKPTKHNVLVNLRGSLFALDSFVASKVVVYA